MLLEENLWLLSFASIVDYLIKTLIKSIITMLWMK